jgi:hypothetical protein
MRGLNRIAGQGKDKEWILPRYKAPMQYNREREF